MAKFGALEKQVQRDFKNALKKTASHLNTMIEESYEIAIYAFYNDYEPKYYRRTESTYYASDMFGKIEEKYNPEIGNGKYFAGINVSPSFIKGNPYRADKDWVFYRTYFLGIHGQTGKEQVQFGQSEWWDKKLRGDKKIKLKFGQWWILKQTGMKLNQYKKYRRINTLSNTMYLMSSVQHNNQMGYGSRPVDIMWNSYKVIRKPQYWKKILNEYMLLEFSNNR